MALPSLNLPMDLDNKNQTTCPPGLYGSTVSDSFLL